MRAEYRVNIPCCSYAMAVALLTSVLTSKLVSLSRKTNCKLGISRIKLLRNKKQIAVRLGDLVGCSGWRLALGQAPGSFPQNPDVGLVRLDGIP